MVVNQIKGVYKAKDLIMHKYLGRVLTLERELSEQVIWFNINAYPKRKMKRYTYLANYWQRS